MGTSSSKGDVQEHRYTSGNWYKGQMSRGKRHGKGKYFWTDGTVYEGDFRGNQMHGYGTMRFTNGNVYEGGFMQNNPGGAGVLRTICGEVIAGDWTYVGRSNMIYNAHDHPVGKYTLAVTVTDNATGRQQRYCGPATLHLDNGMLVLPNMEAPRSEVTPTVMAYASAFVADGGRELLQNAYSIGNANMLPMASAAPADVVVATQVLSDEETRQGELEQRLIDAEEQAELQAEIAQAAQLGQGPGVAYGYQDPALQERHPRPPDQKVNLLDPRNYF